MRQIAVIATICREILRGGLGSHAVVQAFAWMRATQRQFHARPNYERIHAGARHWTASRWRRCRRPGGSLAANKSDAQPEPQPQEGPQVADFPYEKHIAADFQLDVAALKEAAYNAYYNGGCCHGAYSALLGDLQIAPARRSRSCRSTSASSAAAASRATARSAARSSAASS